MVGGPAIEVVKSISIHHGSTRRQISALGPTDHSLVDIALAQVWFTSWSNLVFWHKNLKPYD